MSRRMNEAGMSPRKRGTATTFNLPKEYRTLRQRGRQPRFLDQTSLLSRRSGHHEYVGSSEDAAFSGGPPPAQIEGPIMRHLETWQKWPELTLRVTNLSLNVTTLQLWERFAREGNVVLIELFENRDGDREPNANIRFSPVPKADFWSLRAPPFFMPAVDGEGQVQLRMTPQPRKRNPDYEIQSPISRSVYYPEIMILHGSSITFGLMVNENSMMCMQDAKNLEILNDITFEVNLVKNRITARFLLDPSSPNPSLDLEELRQSYQRYMFQIPFEQPKKIYKIDIDSNHWAIIIILDSPPQFYRQRNILSSHNDDALVWSEFDSYYRQTDIVYDRTHVKSSPIALEKINPTIDIGRWTAYRLVFHKERDGSELPKKMMKALQDWNIEIIEDTKFVFVPPMSAPVWSLLNSGQATDAGTDLDILSRLRENEYYLPFEVRYQLEACISANKINEHNISPEFLQTLSKIAAQDTEKAKSILEWVLDEGNGRVYDPMSLFTNRAALDHSRDHKMPEYCALSRKATVTPSTIYFSSPTVETTNRVTREYRKLGDRFLRVQFTDEKFEGRINSCADKVRNDEIYTRVYRTLDKGIMVAGRKYEFLAFGNAQFRENGAYFFCPTEQITCDSIRKWMGDFTQIRVVAKCAARLGQCFSTTRAIGGRVQIKPIEDVERNGYCFTDGVGKISDVLASRIADELGIKDGPVPSAFQFRMGGCKGVLTVSPEVKGAQVHIRRSQEKFKATYNGLEVIRCSRFSVATLNRQTITILSSLGVSDDIFTEMLGEQLKSYHDAMTDKKLALDRLFLYVDENQTTVTIAKMVLDGFMESKEPFLVSLLNLWRAWSIKLLKEKARIVVEKAAFVLGCTDESQTLKGHYNRYQLPGRAIEDEHLPEIFLQVPDKDKKGEYVVITGRCVLGRNPSLHPGDLRVVMAVDKPALRHLRDVVVFPQLGDRDIPSMCSGGDLDGDDFFVIWDQNLMPKEINCVPMEFEPAKPVVEDREVTVVDMARFFVRYMKNDALPKIAHAHLAYCDWLTAGPKDPKAVKLAQLHSKAVDYVKTGERAIMDKSDTPRQWPHFMEKKHKSTYVSNEILGQLYDQVQKVDFAPEYEAPFDERVLKRYQLDSGVLKIARQLKTQYDIAVRRIMAQHEINTEFEVWTTFVLSKPRVGSDYKLQETMENVTGALRDRFRQICIEKAGGKEFDTLAPFVASMYRVTHEEMQIALHECQTTRNFGGRERPQRKMEPKFMPLISFPWLFPEVMGKIATGLETREELDDLGLAIYQPRNMTARKVSRESSNPMEEDVLETAEGAVIHRGEALDLFGHADIDSDGDPVEHPSVKESVHKRAIKQKNSSESLMMSGLKEEMLTSAKQQADPPLKDQHYYISTPRTPPPEFVDTATSSSEYTQSTTQVTAEPTSSKAASSLLDDSPQRQKEYYWNQVNDHFPVVDPSTAFGGLVDTSNYPTILGLGYEPILSVKGRCAALILSSGSRTRSSVSASALAQLEQLEVPQDKIHQGTSKVAPLNPSAKNFTPTTSLADLVHIDFSGRFDNKSPKETALLLDIPVSEPVDSRPASASSMAAMENIKFAPTIASDLAKRDSIASQHFDDLAGLTFGAVRANTRQALQERSTSAQKEHHNASEGVTSSQNTPSTNHIVLTWDASLDSNAQSSPIEQNTSHEPRSHSSGPHTLTREHSSEMEVEEDIEEDIEESVNLGRVVESDIDKLARLVADF